MGKTVSAAGFLAPKNPMTNNKLIVMRAQDSTSMVIMVLYNPLIPPDIPKVVQTSLQCRRSRIMIIRVRRMLSATEIEKYGTPKRRRIVI